MRRTYTDEERVATLATLETNGGNVSRTSAETGVKRETIIRWRGVIAPHMAPDPESYGSLSDRSDSLASRVLHRLELIAQGDMRDVVSWDAVGNAELIPSANMTPAQSALVGELRFKDGVVTAIRTRDVLSALRTLASVAGLLHHEELPPRGDDNSQHLTVNVIGQVSDDVLLRRVAAARTIVEGA